MKRNRDCKNDIFSDEKRFNLDVPHSFNCYWDYLRKVRDIRWSFKGRFLTVWGSISANSKTDLVIVLNTISAEVYLKILDVQF